MDTSASEATSRATGDTTGEATVWVSYAEGARRLGIKPESFKRRSLERRWPRKQGNDGRALVAVPGSIFEEAAGEITGESASEITGGCAEDIASGTSALAEHLKGEFEEAKRELRAARADAVEARDRAAKAETEAEHQGRAAADLRQELLARTVELETRRTEAMEARERAARAEGELAGMRSGGLWARLWGRG